MRKKHSTTWVLVKHIEGLWHRRNQLGFGRYYLLYHEIKFWLSGDRDVRGVHINWSKEVGASGWAKRVPLSYILLFANSSTASTASNITFLKLTNYEKIHVANNVSMCWFIMLLKISHSYLTTMHLVGINGRVLFGR